MITDPLPRLKSLQTLYFQSDELLNLELPLPQTMRSYLANIKNALENEQFDHVGGECSQLLKNFSSFYRVQCPSVKVMNVRPHRVENGVCVYEKFGDYHPRSMRIRLWMRTAIRKKTTSLGTFVSTLCHEFCHHVDIKMLNFYTSPHTVGFYRRTALLYHRVMGTPVKRLVFVKRVNRWVVDWSLTNDYNLLPSSILKLGVRAGNIKLA